MLSGYTPILVMIVVAGLLGVAMVVGSLLLGPKKPTRFKETAYECGMTPIGSARERFPIRFYVVAMLFIIFDIETVFLYPWAVTFIHGDRATKLFNLGEMAVFVIILFVGYFYLIGRGALNWDEGRELDPDGSASVPVSHTPRTPIRFGNESSGPVDLSKASRVSGASEAAHDI